MRMRSPLLLAVLLTIVAGRGNAQAPADTGRSSLGIPRDATARCTDRTFSTSRVRTGTCSSHGGIRNWYGLPGRRITRCNDGYYSMSTGSGTCSTHKGVWYLVPRKAPKP